MVLPRTGDLLIGRYRLEARLGEGAASIVFAARNRLLGHRIAVKVFRPDDQDGSVPRFLDEARAAAHVRSEHVAAVFDVGTLESGLPFLVLELLEGAHLARVLAERGPLRVADAVDYLLQTIEALANAHALGIVHGDVKPSNLFLARRADRTSRVKVLDLGVSNAVKRVTSQRPSPLTISPEQLRGANGIDRRADIWALGAVAYELLTGRAPFPADDAVARFASVHGSAPEGVCSSRSDVASSLNAAIMRCLRPDPDERFSSVHELASELVPFAGFAGVRAFDMTSRVGRSLSGSRPRADGAS